MKKELNRYDIFITDKFILNYYDTILIFEVCQTEWEQVAIYELEVKEGEFAGRRGFMLDEKLKPSKNPYLVPEEKNSYSKSDYFVQPSTLFGDPRLLIEIPFGSKLYNKAIEKGYENPMFGMVYAEKIDEYRGVCWLLPEEEDDESPGFTCEA